MSGDVVDRELLAKEAWPFLPSGTQRPNKQSDISTEGFCSKSDSKALGIGLLDLARLSIANGWCDVACSQTI